MVDGAAYFPLVAQCPAASCANGDPIANAIADAGTKAYLEAIAKKAEKDLNVATAVLGVGGAIVRAVETVAETVATATAAARAAETVRVGAKGTATAETLIKNAADIDAAVLAARQAQLAGTDVSQAAKNIADLSTHTSGSTNRVVLGRWVEDGGYIAEAKVNGGIWYETPPGTFEKLTEGLSSDQARQLAWNVNQQFLKTQLQNGVLRIDLVGESIEQVLINRPTSFTAMEIKFLEQTASQYGYVRSGSSWMKVKQ